MTSRQATDAENASQASVVDAHALLAAAVDAAGMAATLVRDRASEASSIEWEVKSHADFVSDIDRAAEAVIARTLLAHFPDAVVVGEELSPGATTGSEPSLAFIVDPLDGTTNFLHGYPEYAVSIGATIAGDLVAGVVINIPSGERFTAIRGGGAMRDGLPIRVSPIADPRLALIGTGFPFKHPDMLPAYQRQFARVLRETSGIRRCGSAALDLCDVACGRFDGFWELRLAPWDVAAGILIVRESGGRVTDLEGRDSPVGHGPIVAGNPVILDWLLAMLRET